MIDLLVSAKVDLRTHLTAHAKERPEDFEEVEQRPSSLVAQHAKTRDSKVLTCVHGWRPQSQPVVIG